MQKKEKRKDEVPCKEKKEVGKESLSETTLPTTQTSESKKGKGKGKSKSKNKRSANKSSGSKEVAKFIKSYSSTNDISWYKHYPDMTSDTSRVLMSRPLGYTYPSFNRDRIRLQGKFSLDDTQFRYQGGILRLDMIPTWGGYENSSSISNSALNTAAAKLYYYVVHSNSRNISYDKSDLMRTFMAFDSLCMVIAEAKRAYAFIKAIDPNNRWVKQIITALGWDYDNLFNNIVRMRTTINMTIQKLNQFRFPKVFDMFKAHTELFEHVYEDRTGLKTQFMACTSPGVWVYLDEFGSLDFIEQGTYAGRHFNWSNERYKTVDDLEIITDLMLHTLYDSSYIGVIQADIKRAFERNGDYISVDMIEESTELPIVYDEEFNLKLHNIEFLGSSNFNVEYVTSSVDNLNYRAWATYRDENSAGGNLLPVFKVFDDANPQPWLFENKTHIMDLPDHVKDDVDAVLLMQLFKVANPVNVRTKFHLEDQGEILSCQFMCGPFIAFKAKYYADIAVPTKYTELAVDRLVNFNNPAVGIKEVGELVQLWEFGVTMPIPLMCCYSTDAGRKVVPLPMPYEINNVTLYSDQVVENILHTIVESLYYNDLLYVAH